MSEEKTSRNQTTQVRWHESGSYSDKWLERNSKLFSLFMDAEFVESKRYKVAEMGCGANKPMVALLDGQDAFEVSAYDLVQWDDQTKEIDLNKQSFDLEGYDIATFCGVLEYINDWDSLFSEVMARCDYMLLSYAFMPQSKLERDFEFIGTLGRRVAGKGWRNHLTAYDFVKYISQYGVISHTGLWRKHILVVLRNFNVDHKE